MYIVPAAKRYWAVAAMTQPPVSERSSETIRLAILAGSAGAGTLTIVNIPAFTPTPSARHVNRLANPAFGFIHRVAV